MKLLRAIFWSMVAVFLGIWLFSTRACAQDAVPSYEPEAPHTVPYFTVLPDAPVSGHVCYQPVNITSDFDKLPWKVVSCPDEERAAAVKFTQYAPKHHNWFYRHPVWVGLIAGGTFGGVWALTHREGCPRTVSGFPYDGNGRPCPAYCEAQGDCYWPTK